MSNAPQQSIILLEDIDAAFNPKQLLTTTTEKQQYCGRYEKKIATF